MSRDKLIDERVTALGFDSFDAFLEARPGVGLVALADELGRPILGVDIVRALLTRAHARGGEQFREGAIDLLARHMNEVLVNGWGRLRPVDNAETDVETVNITPWALWSSELSNVDGSTEDRAFAVLQELKSMAQQGWKPADKNDPILRRAFDTAWLLA